MNKPSIWFLVPSVQVASGGTNNTYRLCELADEIGIKARVVSKSAYPITDPEYLAKYWIHEDEQMSLVQEGDLIVTPEMWPERPTYKIPIRRVKYVQGWSLAHRRLPHETIFWYYNQTNLGYALSSVGVPELEIATLSPEGMTLKDWEPRIVSEEHTTWHKVQPYFIEKEFSVPRDRNKICMMPRRCPEIVQKAKELFKDNLVIIDGVKPAEVQKIMRGCGIFLLATPAEGLSFPAVEALLSGLCVVGWVCGGPEEFLIDGITAEMVQYGHYNDMFHRAQQLQNNHDKQEFLAKNGKDLVTRLYTREGSKLELFIAYHAALLRTPVL